MRESRSLLNLTTREVALISVLSSVWIAAQIYLGPIIGGITGMHGMVNRVVGWFLMLILAALTDRFGRVSIMAATASLATRIIRRSTLEGFIVGSGYVLGGIAFDLLYFVPIVGNPQGRARNAYVLTISTLSGLIASVPYLLSKLYFLGSYGFVAWLPINVYRIVKDIVLSSLGGFAGQLVSPQVRFWGAAKGDKANRPSTTKALPQTSQENEATAKDACP